MRVNLLQAILITAMCACFRWTNGQRLLSVNSQMPDLIKPSISTNKTRLTILFSLRYGGIVYPLGPVGTEAARVAVDVVQKLGILPDYELAIEAIDNKCLRFSVIATLLAELEKNSIAANRIPVLVGPDCEQITSGQLIKFYNFVGLSVGSAQLDVYSKRDMYRSYFIATPSTQILCEAIPYFVKSNGWKKVFLLSETSALFDPLDRVVQRGLLNLGIQLVAIVKVFTLVGTIPSSEAFQDAVEQLAKFDSRVIIFNGNFGIRAACWLARLGLFGPGYVIISFPSGAYYPDSPLKFSPWCTEKMLFDVLQSTIFVHIGAMINLDNRVEDSVGVSAKWIDETMKKRGVNPADNTGYYECCNSLTYEQIIIAALALNRTEQKLQKANQTLKDWVTSGQLFKSRGQEIRELLSESLSEIVYSGFLSEVNASMNALSGVVGFYKYQAVREPTEDDLTQNLAKLLKTTIFATFDTSRPQLGIKPLSSIPWRTPNRLPPADSLVVLSVNVPLTNTAIQIGVFTTAAICFFLHFAAFCLLIRKYRSDEFVRSAQIFNTLVPVGSCIMMIGVIVVPSGLSVTAGSICMARSCLLTLGFGIIIMALHAKMNAGHAMRITAEEQRSYFRLKNLKVRVEFNPVVGLNRYRSVNRRNLYSVLSFVTVVSALITIWFSIAPIRTIQIDFNLQPSLSDLNLVYQPYSYYCSIKERSPITTISSVEVLLSIICSLFGIVFLRGLFLAYSLRHAIVMDMEDLSSVRFATYATCITTIGGGVIAAVLFSAGSMETAISISVILLNAAIFSILFGPRLASKWTTHSERSDSASARRQTTVESHSNLKQNTAK